MPIRRDRLVNSALLGDDRASDAVREKGISPRVWSPDDLGHLTEYVRKVNRLSIAPEAPRLRPDTRPCRTHRATIAALPRRPLPAGADARRGNPSEPDSRSGFGDRGTRPIPSNRRAAVSPTAIVAPAQSEVRDASLRRARRRGRARTCRRPERQARSLGRSYLRVSAKQTCRHRPFVRDGSRPSRRALLRSRVP